MSLEAVNACTVQVADLGAVFRFMVAMVEDEGWELPDVLQLMTSNPAEMLQLPQKGQALPRRKVYSCTLRHQSYECLICLYDLS